MCDDFILGKLSRSFKNQRATYTYLGAIPLHNKDFIELLSIDFQDETLTERPKPRTKITVSSDSYPVLLIVRAQRKEILVSE